MVKVTVTLPDALRTYVEQKLLREGYNSPGEYICALIREDQQREPMERLGELLVEFSWMDLPLEIPDECWLEMKDELVQRVRRERNHQPVGPDAEEGGTHLAD